VKSVAREWKLGEQTMNTEDLIENVCSDIQEMLIQKNRAYGDSALDPVRIFAKSDAVEQIYVRIDDKLSRVKRGHEYPGDDTIKDLVGYLVLLLVAKEKQHGS
jgi:hypothetical protein